MDQLFFIAMTMQGFGWNDLMSLTDRDRIALVEKCSAYNDRQQSEVDKIKSRTR